MVEHPAIYEINTWDFAEKSDGVRIEHPDRGPVHGRLGGDAGYPRPRSRK